MAPAFPLIRIKSKMPYEELDGLIVLPYLVSTLTDQRGRWAPELTNLFGNVGSYFQIGTKDKKQKQSIIYILYLSARLK
jgi:hypothetical protein